MIVKASVKDANELTEIALQSKAFWGYSKSQVEDWRSDLTVTSNMIRAWQTYKFLVDGKSVGFYVLNQSKDNSAELEMLFVLPSFIGKGIGKQLVEHAFIKAIEQQSKTLTLIADPNAVDFYESQGFYEIGKQESSILGRFLLVMQKDLAV